MTGSCHQRQKVCFHEIDFLATETGIQAWKLQTSIKQSVQLLSSTQSEQLPL